MVSECLSRMQVDFSREVIDPRKDTYLEMVDGNKGQQRIFRIQFEGPWMNGPAAAQYRKTHYIACLQSGIVDPMYDPCEIVQHEEWMDLALVMYPELVKKCTGYHSTHVWNIWE